MGANGNLAKAIILYSRKEYKKALDELLSQEVPKDEYHILSYYLGLCYLKLEKTDEALLYLEQAITDKTSSEYIYRSKMLIGYLNSSAGKYSIAEREFKSIIDMGFKNSTIFCALGHVYFMQGNKDEALKLLRQSVSLNNKNINAINSFNYIRATTTDDNKILGECLINLQNASSASPDNPSILDSIGFVYSKMGKKEDARTYYKKALALNPNSKEIANHLKEIDGKK